MSKTPDYADATGLPHKTDRRQLLIGIMALSVAGTHCVASPLAVLGKETRAAMEARFLELWDRMDREQQLACLDLLRELAELPEGAEDRHIFAAAAVRRAKLRWVS